MTRTVQDTACIPIMAGRVYTEQLEVYRAGRVMYVCMYTFQQSLNQLTAHRKTKLKIKFHQPQIIRMLPK